MATERDDLCEQTELYVLGALTDDERAAFEAHLASCEACTADVRALSGVAGALAHAVPQVDPPPGLRARLIASVTGRVATLADVVEMRPSPAVARSSFMPWLAAAAVLLAAGLGLFGMYTAQQLRARNDALDARLHDATRRAETSERQTADARRAVADAESRTAVLAAPDLTRIDLVGQPAAPQAYARAYWSRSRGMVFTAANLPALPPGRIYQLWVLSAQPAPTSAKLMRPDASGRIDIMFATPADLPQPTALALTIEPERGVPAPTGDKYLVGAAPASS